MQVVWYTNSAVVQQTIEPLLQQWPNATIIFSNTLIANTTLYIDACTTENLQPFIAETHIPILKNAVVTTQVAANTIRCNFWPGFFNGNNKLEVAHANEHFINTVFAAIPWQYSITPNIMGFISARVVSNIINEAFFALEQGVSTKEDIDIAMRLGTNYPFGPFEWAAAIGHSTVVSLLQQLSVQHSKYTPANNLVAMQ